MRKKFAALMAALLLLGALAMAGCQQSGGSTEPEESSAATAAAETPEETGEAQTDTDDKITIGYAVYNFTNPYYFGIMTVEILRQRSWAARSYGKAARAALKKNSPL